MERTEDIIIIARRIWEEEFRRQAAVLSSAGKTQLTLKDDSGKTDGPPTKNSTGGNRRPCAR